MAGVTLLHASDSQSFALVLGDAFQATSKLLLAISILAWLLNRRGVAVRHFGWDEATLGAAASTLRTFAALRPPLLRRCIERA